MHRLARDSPASIYHRRATHGKTARPVSPAARGTVELHNLYGPTEAAVQVTHHHCVADEGLDPIPIGRPIANTRVYILDPQGPPQPIGVPGEIYLEESASHVATLTGPS